MPRLRRKARLRARARSRRAQARKHILLDHHPARVTPAAQPVEDAGERHRAGPSSQKMPRRTDV